MSFIFQTTIIPISDKNTRPNSKSTVLKLLNSCFIKQSKMCPENTLVYITVY